MARLRVAVLISGRGSNLQALIEACADPGFPAEIVSVVSNVPGAAGLARAAMAGIANQVLDHRDFADRESFEAGLQAILADAKAELICLAGFMRLLNEGFVTSWNDRMINIHPSLLPAYRGLHSHARAIADGVRVTGCTVHFVRPAMDQGPIIVQAAVAVDQNDDADSLARRVIEAEHRCYPLALRLIAEGRVRVDGGRVLIEDAPALAPALINPLDRSGDRPGDRPADTETD